MTKSNTTKPGLVKQSLNAHKWLGLFISSLMYIICLSGTIVVFFQELERWEQPEVTETSTFTNDQITKAYDNFVASYPQKTSHMHVVFPSSGIPRVVVENDHLAHFVNHDGSLAQVEKPSWTKMLIDLHLYLHLPKNFGMIFVSACGALLFGLIISGILAHPRIIKDAFRFRRGNTGLQENIDLHNRFSVWAAPFHIMIAITGAYFGLVSVLILIIAQAFYDGDTQAVVDVAFTPEPTLEQPLVTPNIAKALDDVQDRSPDGKLIFLTVHEPHTTGQFTEIYVKQPQRLIYSENYRYDINGDFIGLGGYKEGDIGKQVIYSIYRLHFGDFAGVPSKVIYFILGMMLTIISATGINIWLLKRKTRDRLNLIWPAIVWGTPIALVIIAWINLYTAARLDVLLWLGIIAVCVFSCNFKQENRLKGILKLILGISIILFVIAYCLNHKASALAIAALQVNIPLLLFGFYLIINNIRVNDKTKATS